MMSDFEVGVAHHEAGRLDQARACYEKLLSEQPRHSDALHLLGTIHLKQRDLKRGIPLIRQAVAVNPGLQAAWNNLGVALTWAGAYDDAVSALRRAIALESEDASSHCNLADALSRQERLEEAVASYRTAISIGPGFLGAHFKLGRTLRTLGRLQEAAEAFATAVELKPDFTMAKRQLGGVLILLGRHREGLRRLMETDGTIEISIDRKGSFRLLGPD